MNLLDLIAVPDVLTGLLKSDEGRAVLAMFSEIDAQHPEFFPYVAQLAGIGLPLAGQGDTERDAVVNEGKRLLGIELLALLRLSHEPEQRNE